MPYESTIRFAKLSFEPKILHPQNENQNEKLQREKGLLLEIINYELNISKLLESADKKYHAQRVKGRSKFNIERIDSLINDSEWRFGDIDVGTNYLMGGLAKVSKENELILDDQKKGFKDTEQFKIFVSEFFIDLENHIFAYEVKKQIGPVMPTNLLRDVFNSYYGTREKLTINPLPNREKIADKIKKFKNITFIKLTLKIPNPHSYSLNQSFDEWMRSVKANSVDLTARSNTGLDLDDNLISSGIAQAEEGNGGLIIKNKVVVKGESREQEIRSSHYPITKKMTIPKDKEARISALKRKINDILFSFSDDEGDNSVK